MASKQTPTFVITPGAWHPTSCGDLLVEQLKSAGYSTEACGLKSAGSTTGPMTEDVAHMRETYVSLIESGKEIVPVFHSYAGFPGSTAIQGLTKKDRQSQGKSGGILGVIYMAAFIPQPGVSLKANIGGAWPEWMDIDEASGKMHVNKPVETFYDDVPQDLADKTKATLTYQSLQAMTDVPGELAFKESMFDGRRAYIRCENDKAIPAFVQDMMIESSKVDWNVIKMDTAHSPFLAKPKETADNLIAAIKGWSD